MLENEGQIEFKTLSSDFAVSAARRLHFRKMYYPK